MTSELAVAPDRAPGSPVAHIKRLRDAMEAIQEAKEALLTLDVDYGQIPGTDKPTLYQPGAELLLKLFGYGFRYEIEERVEDWDTPFFRYQMKGIITDGVGNTVAEGPGEANSREPRYLRRQCPKCQSGVWDNRRQQAEGKFLDQKAFACKSKRCEWGSDSAAEVPEVFDFSLVNTMLKMAVKRAKVSAALTATGGSHFFTQDLEDQEPVTNVDAPASTSRPSGGQGGQSGGLVCPACGSSVYDNRADIDSGKLKEKYPVFKCSNKSCTGVDSDGQKVTDAKEAGEPWVTWHRNYFEEGPSPDMDSTEMKEVVAHIESGAISESAVHSIARRVAREANVEPPQSLTGIGGLDTEVQVAIAEAVAVKIGEGE